MYLDFAKAFDKVDHSILINKLPKVGIRGRLLKWISDFLRGRKQFVAVDGAVSSESDVISGVPQGTVLGPLLFLVYMVDINNQTQFCNVRSFAYDTRVMKAIDSVEDCHSMQRDLNRTYISVGRY